MFDSFTHYAWIYMLKEPRQALEKLREFSGKVQFIHNAKIENLYTDDVELFSLQEFKVLFDELEINHEIAKKASTWQSSLCAKVATELQDGMRGQLRKAGLTQENWGESLNCFVHHWCRMVHKDMNCSPFEKLYNRKPNVAYLKKFGTRLQVSMGDGTVDKGILMGYEKGQYKVLLPYSDTVVLTRDVECTGREEQNVLQSYLINVNETEYSDTESDTQSDTQSSDTDDTVIDRYALSRPQDETDLDVQGPSFTIGRHSPKEERPSREDQHLIRRSERFTKGVPPKRYAQEFAKTAVANIAVTSISEQVTHSHMRVAKSNDVSSQRDRASTLKALVPWKMNDASLEGDTTDAGSSKDGTGTYYVYDNCLFKSLNDAFAYAEDQY